MTRLTKFENARSKAYQELRERFDCQHEDVQTRKRVIAGGAIQFIGQCQRCGYTVGNAVGRDRALRDSGGKEPLPLDAGIRQRWDEKRSDEMNEIEAQFGREAFFDGYDDYLKSDAWADRRARVMHRCGGTCEGCGKRKASQVHHLTYAHVGDEFLFELVALCHPCHERIHADDK